MAYSWYRPDGKHLPEHSRQEDWNRKLIVPDVKAEDTGEYRCKVTGNLNTTSEKSISLTIGECITDVLDGGVSSTQELKIYQRMVVRIWANLGLDSSTFSIFDFILSLFRSKLCFLGLRANSLLWAVQVKG